ncbi:class I SAM-dependent methyltransferase [Flavobacterium sp. N3904]|uniref:class I SAM-dependent methyltransferase n=1 Tax=Flavobacterium sp. N3904 TaxID=2986835 RepID=UPI002223F2F3|nr:class I SAM-dependent methyltransferase [Flavobacterium sp. N3904]
MRDQIKSAIGNVLITLFPKKAESLEKRGLTMIDQKFSFMERQMRNAILNKAEAKNNFDKLSKIHNSYWVNQGKDVFEWNNSFKNNFLPHCTFIYKIVKEKFFKDEIQFTTLVEIGTGNGDVLNYLESNFPEIDKFIGIDLSSEQIKINKEKYKENLRLEFIAADVIEWVKKEGHKNTIFATSNGVFEYFTEHQLREFIKYTHSLGKVLFIIIEPTVINHNFDLNPNSIVYGIEKSFSHNYCKIFHDFGFKIFHHSKKQILGIGSNCEMNYILAGN